MDWKSVITTVVSSGIMVSAIAWLAKTIVSRYVDRDLERFKSELESRAALTIEEFRSNVQLEAQKRIIEYTSLHGKRAHIIADLYTRLSDLYTHIRGLISQYQIRELKQKITQDIPLAPSSPHDDLKHITAEEEEAVERVKSCNKEFVEFYSRNRIYFSSVVCQLADRMSGLASYVAMAYRSVTLKDKNGNLYVNAEVKDTWDKAVVTIPQLLSELEKEFRCILGVS